MCKTITIKCNCEGCQEEKNSVFIAQGQELVFKTSIEGDNTKLEERDYVLKNINGQLVSGFFLGGDKEDSNNYGTFNN